WGCSVDGGAIGVGNGRGPFALVAMGFLGWLARSIRRRQIRRIAIKRLTACAFALIAVIASTAATRDAHASVSVAVLFEELVRDASAVATVTPLEQRSVWENGRIYSYSRVNVDALLVGAMPREVWIRTMGGVVGTIGQIVDGEPTFAI